MNKGRRNWLSEVEGRLRNRLDCGITLMGATPEGTDEFKGLISDEMSTLQTILDEEQECYDNTPESFETRREYLRTLSRV